MMIVMMMMMIVIITVMVDITELSNQSNLHDKLLLHQGLLASLCLEADGLATAPPWA